jgi:Methyltransferase domain
MPETLHGYYAEQEIMPTHGGFTSPADLDAYQAERARIFTDKLKLPPRTFAGARLLELGPDTGENSLVFARWGAACTLSEPHVRAHAVIREYFDRFGLSGRLEDLEEHGFETYPPPAPERRFDVVDAEGFVNAIQPPSAWIDRLPGLVADDGFAVLFYYEAYGCLFELTWKVVHARYRELTGLGRAEAAEEVFAAKWASIPHKRPLAAWAMDVLENPFVRLETFLDARELCRAMTHAGFVLHSAWPSYDGGLDVHWFKRDRTPEARLAEQVDFIGRSRLSHLFGRKHFLASAEVLDESMLQGALQHMDALVDGWDGQRAKQLDAHLAAVSAALELPTVLADPDDTRRSVEGVDMLRRLLHVLGDGVPERIAAFCNGDAAFVEAWGLPSHFAVFRKLPA